MASGVVQAEVQRLVEHTRAAATRQDAEGLRGAYEQVLNRLRVAPEHLEAWRDGLDIVGSAYEQLLTPYQRRTAGQFFTPFWAGELMAGWLFTEPARLLVDAGCGSGGLLIPAARHHARGSARLVGIDTDPVAIAMAAANRRIRGMDSCELRIGNFLAEAPAVAPDRLVSNPPYSRHTAIPLHDRVLIHDELTRAFGARFSRRTSLQALFLLRAIEVSADSAWLAFITPSDWLDVNYGREVKRILTDRAHVEALIYLDAEHLFFDGARTTAVITLIRKGVSATSTKVVRLEKTLPDPTTVLDAVRGLDVGLRVAEQRLGVDFKWARTKVRQRRGVRLGELARVHRGIATGANSFFCLSESRRVELGIAVSDLRPCLSSPKHFAIGDITQSMLDELPGTTRRWLIDTADPGALLAKNPLGVYLRRGKRLKIHTGYLASRRTPWYAQEQRPNAPIIFTYLNKLHPRFLRNRADAVPLNNWLVIAPKDGVDPDELFAALTSSSVESQLREQARVYGGGLWKLEPSELQGILLPETLQAPAP